MQLYPASSDNSIPSGIIAMWSGASNAIPSGWFLCDGNNNTPDLRNRFIVGAGSTYSVGNTGGSDSVTLTTNQMPSHRHGNNFSISMSGLTLQAQRVSSAVHSYGVAVEKGPFDGSWTNVENTRISGSGSLSGSISNTGGGQSHENRPPYYALCFIMKA